MAARAGSSLRLWCIPIGVLALLSLVLPKGAPGAPAPVSFTLTGTAGSNGWHTSDVTIRWTVEPTDLVDTSGCPAAEQITAEGASTRQCIATFTWGTVTSPVVTVRIDKTPPTVPAGTPARGPDSNGWYNRLVGVGFAATDVVSGIDSCTGGAYSGPDSASAAVTGICTDRAGNTRPGTFALQYDSTAPGVAAAASRAPDANGWYNGSLSVSFAQSPGDVSGPGTCSPPASYGGPDSATASVSGTCTDRAGNTSAPLAFGLKYDATAPQALAAADRGADANGWFNHALTISFQQAPGDLSGPGSCSGAATYSGPDAASASRSGTCTDRAGNTSSAVAFAFKYDGTAPSAAGVLARSPDRNSWYNHPVGLDVTGVDALSGVASCTSPTYAGPDGPSRVVSGTCSDLAGNTSAAATVTLKYDATPPGAIAAASRGPDANGWYRAPLTISFGQAAGDVSGPDTCSSPATYSGPDAANVSRSGSCTDMAGNTSSPAALAFKYDSTPPTAVASADRPANANGWYRQQVTISFAQLAGDLSGADTCAAPVNYSGPDSADVSRSGSCTDKAGNTSAPAALAFKYDASPPTASGSLARAPDVNGWYNRPVALNLTGSDAMSGVASCTTPSYSGPDGDARAVSGTCADRAGNTSAPAGASLKYDATPPTANAAASRAPDSNGWYNHALTVSFTQAAGDVSGPDTCSAPVSYSGPDNADVSQSGTCRDNAGNTSAPATLTLRYDATPPSATGGLARLPDANGWYNQPVALGVTGADATSGVASCTGPTYSGPDGSAQTLAGSCTDRAGNTNSNVTATFKYDATRPTASGSLARAPDVDGWYNRPVALALTGTDATSGIGSCGGSYAGPDGASRQVSGTCTDVAGNASAPVTATLKYDATPPSATGSLTRAPDVNGWYTQPVALNVTGSDATSGLASCAGANYSGPDGSAQQVSGTCTDKAGNTSAPAGVSLAYDATPPATNAVPDRGGENGWYREPVTVSLVATDPVSGVAVCSPPLTYAGPDTGGASLGGSCSDAAGNASSAAFTVKFDATQPSMSAGLDRQPDGNGWFNHPVGVVASGTDGVSGIASCSGPSYSGPDSASVSLGVSCRDNAGNTSSSSVSLRYDATAPAASTSADRPPDRGGWYRRALTVSFAGSDAMSGIESCTAPVRYTGPDRGNGAIAGTCRDAAGNVAERMHVFRYDATAPALTKAAAELVRGDARITWRRSADAVTVQIVRTPGRNGAKSTVVYRGAGTSFVDETVRAGLRYRYGLHAEDAAGNIADAAVAVTARQLLYRPAPGSVVRAPVRLAWEPQRGARFYNLQLRRDGVKLLSIWPRASTLLLGSTWRYEGKRYRLDPGTYSWVVWAASGTRERPSYGRPIGTSTFVVKR